MPKAYSLKRKQKIPVSLNTAWNFFCKPDNLKQMVPPNISFTTDAPIESPVIHDGQIIKYKLNTRFGFSLSWIAEIMEVEEKEYYIDELRSGPFSKWRHQHYFVEIPGGVEMSDILHYSCRFGILGDILHVVFFKRRVKQIFDYRSSQLVQLFGEYIEQKN
jgi:ligand-binding SRPBCC domain-containing protein